jgi:hypothetical protein
MCGKHTVSCARTRVASIQRVTEGYVWKIYSELRKDTRSKYTAHYAWKREENIQQVAQGYVCKTYSQLHNQPSNTTCRLLLGTSVQYVCVDSSNILKDSILTSVPTDVDDNIAVKTTIFCVKVVTNFMFHPVTV